MFYFQKDYDGEDKKFVIIDASGFTYIDYMGVEGLKDLHAEFTKKDIQMLIASPKGCSFVSLSEIWPI